MKLVLACCILHNWILEHGIDEVVPPETSWVPNNNVPHGHGVANEDNLSWATLRDEMANQIWANMGHSHI